MSVSSAIGSSNAGQTYSSVSRSDSKSRRKHLRKQQERRKRVDLAVFNYIMAINSLGSNQFTSNHIANSLNLSQFEVAQSIERLNKLGLKINKLC